LPATVPMCRRLSCLDRHALFANSDAHSPANIGREYTLFRTELSYAGIMEALRAPAGGGIAGTVKLPVERTRYYLNHCKSCEKSFDGGRCPVCRRSLAVGVRDRLRNVADRTPAEATASSAFRADPPCRIRLPLPDLLGLECGLTAQSKTVDRLYERLLRALGDERTILGQRSEEEIARASTPGLARAILAQRRESAGWTPANPRQLESGAKPEQMGFELA